MSPEQAQQLRDTLAGSWEADHDVAAGACLQSADEIDLVQQAIFNNASDSLVTTALAGIACRLRAAARLAGIIELACDGADEKPEAGQ